MQKQNILTILTPTYNRAHTLIRCYKSLLKQTHQQFQWLIIDDGSNDETFELIKTLKLKSSKFDIDYYYKENGGKHTALNYAHPFICGELVLILDSDDDLTENAVATVVNYWKNFKDNKSICGLTFLRGQNEKKPLRKGFPDELIISNYIEYQFNKNVSIGDCCEVIRTNVLKEFPFPIFKNEFFLGESHLWINAGLKYQTVYINKIIYITEYLEGGLTKDGRKMRLKNPYGGMYIASLKLSKRFKIKVRFKNMLLYIIYGMIIKDNFKKIKKSNNKFLFHLTYPLALLLFQYWMKKYS